MHIPTVTHRRRSTLRDRKYLPTIRRHGIIALFPLWCVATVLSQFINMAHCHAKTRSWPDTLRTYRQLMHSTEVMRICVGIGTFNDLMPTAQKPNGGTYGLLRICMQSEQFITDVWYAHNYVYSLHIKWLDMQNSPWYSGQITKLKAEVDCLFSSHTAFLSICSTFHPHVSLFIKLP